MTIFHHLRNVILLAITVFFCVETVKAQLSIEAGHYQVDKTLGLIICNTIPDKIGVGTNSITFEKTYTFSAPVNTINSGVAYSVSSNDTIYKLYFTHLPIIAINTKNAAISDTEIGSSITITDTTGASYKSNIGIKIRGAFSSTFPKKSYRVQLWTDSTGLTTKDESMFGLRSDKRWLLLAMYNEKLRLNNKVSHELWLKLHKLYYANLEPDAHSAIRTKYVEVSLNGKYQGVYLFAEDMDRKELKLKKQSTAGTGGELYKGNSWDSGTEFTGLTPLPTELTELWSGWELSYPDADQTDWKNIYNFTDFVVNASDSLFKQQIFSKIREDNFVDYFIFLNLLRAEDNLGKNLFIARYDEKSPYFIAPWDLDGTWGYYWNGDRKNTTDDILSNNLFNRLLAIDDFKKQLATRWFTLRSTMLATDSLVAAINTNHKFLTTNGVYERENMVWPGPYLSYSQDELDYVQSWVQARVTWLDAYFQPFVDRASLISSSSINVYPNPVVTTLQVKGDIEKVTIYSLLGACVYESGSPVSNTIDMQPFTTGMYLVKITQKDGSVSSHRVLVNK